MLDIDRTDHRLLKLLKADARASVTSLATTLGVSRVTVQTRMEKMTRNGVIRRYTIETGVEMQTTAVRAVMFVALQGAMTRRVIRFMKGVPEVVDLHTTNGVWDLVAHIEADSLPDFDRVLREVREIDGVTNSETCLLLDEARIR